ncbi:VOC family protein [Paenibacillus dauci]|uniref:VOC family protein n=1 Tax=Paenibacillus dauci TaxID=1567106 RepID=UPI0006195B63|nr:VOC family protein [Paenibacillus dauci]
MKINHVTIQTYALEETYSFYTDTFGLLGLNKQQDRFSLQIGSSILEFVQTMSNSRPFYHFAFNIPANRFRQAKEWLQKRVILHMEEGTDEVFFKNFDAYSYYFTDPSGNIVELISRQSASPVVEEPFGIAQILNISEINVTTPRLIETGERLIDWGIRPRLDEELGEGLNFMGEGDSFLLLGRPGRIWFSSDKHAEVHPVTIMVDGSKRIEVTAEGEVLLTSVETIG